MSEETTDTPNSGEGSEETSPEPETTQNVTQPAPEPAPTPVDLAATAGDAVAKQPRSLDELGLDGETRTKLESYVSRQINDARDSWEERKQKEITDGQYMTRDEVSGLLTKQAEDTRARESAKDIFVRNLGKMDIQVGSEEYDKIAGYYATAAERGMVNPDILTSEDGLRMLTVMAGVTESNTDSTPAPSQGMPKVHPEGLQHTDGSLQLGAVLSEGQQMPTQMRIEKAMIEALGENV